MKLFITQCLLFIILIAVGICCPMYMWIPFTLMFLIALLLVGLANNWPIIGLLAARIEGRGHLIVIQFTPEGAYNLSIRIDTIITTNTKSPYVLRVVHHRKKTYASGSQYYKVWVQKYHSNSKWLKNTN